MKRYLMAIVLAGWCVSLALGCNLTAIWIPLLLIAGVCQAAEHHHDHWRNW